MRGIDRERRFALLAALTTAGLGLIGPMAALAGRGSWLGALLALPLGLAACWLWQRLGRDLPEGLERGLGPWAGRGAEALYLGWGLFLLMGCGSRAAERVGRLIPEGGSPWLCLAAVLALCLWLSRGDGGVLARAGRLFFLAVAPAVILVVAMALPGMDWRNLWPMESWEIRGLLPCAGLAASLTGYGIYGRCLPGEGEARPGWLWALGGCAGLAVAALATVGAFGPELTARMDEPFQLLLQGARPGGALQRGEAALAAVLALSDMTLLAILVKGIHRLWAGLVPAWRGRGSWLAVLAVFWAAAAFPGAAELLKEPWAAVGNLALGIFLPAVAILTGRGRKACPEESTSCGQKEEKRTDVAP